MFQSRLMNQSAAFAPADIPVESSKSQESGKSAAGSEGGKSSDPFAPKPMYPRKGEESDEE